MHWRLHENQNLRIYRILRTSCSALIVHLITELFYVLMAVSNWVWVTLQLTVSLSVLALNPSGAHDQILAVNRQLQDDGSVL